MRQTARRPQAEGNPVIDIGVNLTDKRFRPDIEAVIARARAAGVEGQILTGTTLPVSRAALALAEAHDGLWATAGVHPHDAKTWTAETAGELKTLLARGAVAVGECGLDYNRDFSPRPQQRAAFEAQLALAIETGKPAFLHERDAHDDFVAIWKAHAPPAGGVVHCFTGGPAEAEAYLALGLHLGITGWICDERRGDGLRAAITRIPLDRLHLETDAPYLTPRDLRPRPKKGRNEPAFLPHIAQTVARLRGEPVEELVAAATANTRRLFAL